jgi:hypothetical protein
VVAYGIFHRSIYSGDMGIDTDRPAQPAVQAEDLMALQNFSRYAHNWRAY